VAKLDKCQFDRSNLPYLGHIVTREGIKTDPDKVKTIQEVKNPTTATEVRAFLGICSYYRKFIKDFADITEPLLQLLKKRAKFVWTDECSNAVTILKQSLMQAPLLQRPNFTKPFTLTCDASEVGMGAVLEQPNENNEMHPVMYWSKTLKPAERRYTTTERECLAIVQAIKNFRHYLYGSHFTVVTDHHALEWLQSAKDLEGRLQRWAMKLQPYDFTIKYRKGKEISNADGLSRLNHNDHPLIIALLKLESPNDTGLQIFVEDDTRTVAVTTRAQLEKQNEDKDNEDYPYDERIVDYRPGQVWDIRDPHINDHIYSKVREQFVEQQPEDPFSGPIHRMLTRRDFPEKKIKLRTSDERVLRSINIKNFRLIDGLIYRILKRQGKEIHQLVIPKPLRSEYLMQIHDSLSGGHLGFNKSYDKLMNRYYWPGMYKDLDVWIKSCVLCQERKGRRPPVTLQPNLITTRPFECIGIDVLGPLPLSNNRHRFIIVFVDHFTGWVEAFPMRNNDATTCAKILVDNIICRYGAPTKILTDRGTPFLASMAHEVYKIFNIHKLQTTAYHPQTNGKVERFNSTLVAMLAMYVSSNQKDWDTLIPFCVFAYNTSRHERSQSSPYYLMFGRNATLPVDAMVRTDSVPYLTANDYVKEIIRRMRIAHRLAQKNQLETANAYRELALSKPPPVYNTGDKVLLQFFREPFGLSKKLGLMWRGPFTVVERKGPVTYRVNIPGASQDKVITVHINRLKPFVERTSREGAAEESARKLFEEELKRQQQVALERATADEIEREKQEDQEIDEESMTQ
jgi:hypothetical protein